MVQPSAPAQHCILPPDAAANFGSSPSTPAVPLRRSRWRVDAVARRHSTPVRSAAPSRRPCAAGAGACSRAASLGVSLWSCKNFIVKVRPRSFSRLASPLQAMHQIRVKSRKSFEVREEKKFNTCEEWKSFEVREEKDFITLPCEKIHNKIIISSCAKKYTAKT